MTRYNSSLSQHLRNFQQDCGAEGSADVSIFFQNVSLCKIFSYSLVHVTECLFSSKKGKDNAALKFYQGVQVLWFLYLLIPVLSTNVESYNGKIQSGCL